MIELKLALRQIDKMDYRDREGKFSIVFMTCHRAKKTGGELIRLDDAYSCGLPSNCKKHEMRGILCNDTGKKYAVHNRLIFQFNNEEIYWI